MKVAVVHDYFNVYAGAERVTKEILVLVPEADVFTLMNQMKEDREFLDGHEIHTSFLDRLPKVERYYRGLFPLFSKAIERFDLSDYDLIISSSHSAAKGVRTQPGQVHICYCHSPARWAWDLKDQYLHEAGLDHGVKGRLASRLIERFRKWDANNSVGVTHFIGNSNYIKERIRRTYGRDASVIYPPVDTDAFTLQQDKEDFYVIVSRLVWYKKARVAVEAFNAMPDKRLIVVGGGPQLHEVKAMAGSNVDVRGHVSHAELQRLMQSAKAMVFVAEEDFGIAPVEAQACGTPVIAFGRGGALETVVDGVTGVFFKAQTPDEIRKAVERFEAMRFHPERIRRHAEAFAPNRFRQEFQDTVRKVTLGDAS